ncbi:MAG: class I SAM-dependent methyltransferase [Magnetococcales bacterium]|nr:class I SAM-dependent methyltransferase [Magnetococcales bacterium]
MSDLATRRKWDGTASFYDLLTYGAEKRWAPVKRELFSRMVPDAAILFAALGTGGDIAFFPPGRNITAIDLSPRMIQRAKPKAETYPGRLQPLVMDLHALAFPDGVFDQVFTSCTFCSVPDPVAGLIALRRVMKPGAGLFMFEHTGSHHFPFGPLLDAVTPLMRPLGPDMNRETVENVRRAGFHLRTVRNHFLDVVKSIEAVAPWT